MKSWTLGQKNVARHIVDRTHIARNLANELYAEPALGQRAADVVASFGGSWTFVAMFVAAMVARARLNAFLGLSHGTAFDPNPYVLLNLFLSMLAAIQPPSS